MDQTLPDQPFYLDKKEVLRFRPNPLVRYLLDTHPTLNMSTLALLPNIPDEDRAQFAQLIGYSLSGWEDLSYVSDEAVARVIAKLDAIK